MGLGDINGGSTVNKFIVIEGLDATGKSTLVENLSSSLDATRLVCPPEIMAPSLGEGPIRQYFDSLNPLQRRAFYRFSNLIASEDASRHLVGGDVVMDRYWTSTAAFAAMDDDFEHDVQLGEYPPEIRVPDLVILLLVDEKNRLKRLQGRGEAETNEELELASNIEKRNAVIAAYKRFNVVIIDTSDKNPEQVCTEAIEIIEELR
jgi:thymidylate kinase